MAAEIGGMGAGDVAGGGGTEDLATLATLETGVGLLQQMTRSLREISHEPFAAGAAVNLLSVGVGKLGVAWKNARLESQQYHTIGEKLTHSLTANARGWATLTGMITGAALKLREIQDEVEETRVAIIRFDTTTANIPGGRGTMVSAEDVMEAKIRAREYGANYQSVYARAYMGIAERVTRTPEVAKIAEAVAPKGPGAGGVKIAEDTATADERMAAALDAAAANVTKLSMALGVDVAPLLASMEDSFGSWGVDIATAGGFVKDFFAAVHDGQIPIKDSKAALSDILGIAQQLGRLGRGPESYADATKAYTSLLKMGFSRQTALQLSQTATKLMDPTTQGIQTRMAMNWALGGGTGLGIKVPTSIEDVTKALVTGVQRTRAGTFAEMGIGVTDVLMRAGMNPETFAALKAHGPVNVNAPEYTGYKMKPMEEYMKEEEKAKFFKPGYMEETFPDMKDKFDTLGTWFDALSSQMELAWHKLSDMTGGAAGKAGEMVLAGASTAASAYLMLRQGANVRALSTAITGLSAAGGAVPAIAAAAPIATTTLGAVGWGAAATEAAAATTGAAAATTGVTATAATSGLATFASALAGVVPILAIFGATMYALKKDADAAMGYRVSREEAALKRGESPFGPSVFADRTQAQQPLKLTVILDPEKFKSSVTQDIYAKLGVQDPTGYGGPGV